MVLSIEQVAGTLNKPATELHKIPCVRFKRGGVVVTTLPDNLRKKVCAVVPTDAQAVYRDAHPNGAPPAECPAAPAPSVTAQADAPSAAPALAVAPPPVPQLQIEIAEAYLKAPDHAKRGIDKYSPILRACEGLVGSELKAFVNEWNQAHPDKKTSYQSIQRKRNELAEMGANALIGKYGKRRGATVVPDDAYNFFKALWLDDRRLTNTNCWQKTYGWARLHGYDMNTFPKVGAFMRRLNNDVPEGAQYRARYGYAAYNRKYGSTMRRTYVDILAGEYWVADHTKADVILLDTSTGKRVRPEVTVWRDMKSGAWLGWDVHGDGSNSTHIFSAFRMAAKQYGIPRDILIDNGKDFRAKDFSGGKKKGHDSGAVTIEQDRLSMCEKLGINVHFAKVYWGQSKPLERDFRIFEEQLVKDFTGYTGNTTVAKPESLSRAIASANLKTLDEFKAFVDDFITNVMNRRIISSGERAGRSPLEIMLEEHKVAAGRGIIRSVTDEQLRLLCYRTSGKMTITRNRIRDSECGADYYADWILAFVGTKVYLRRDYDDMDKADVYDLATNEFLGAVTRVGAVSARADTPATRAELKRQTRETKLAEKVVRIMADPGMEISLADRQAALRSYVAAHEREEVARAALPSIEHSGAPTMLTYENKVIAKKAAMQKHHVPDLDDLDATLDIQPERNPERELVFWDDEMEMAERSAVAAC